MAREQKVQKGAPAWMCTFADMMSLLLCFFVLILSFSVMDQPTFVKVAGSMERAFGIQRENPHAGNPRNEMMISPNFESVPIESRFQRTLIEVVENELKTGLVEVEQEEDGLVLRVKEPVAFDSGSAEIKPHFRPFLDKLGKAAAELNAEVIVSGHTDDRPLQKEAPFASNWSLSASRAVKVVEYWSGKFDIPPRRLTAIGYAHGRPLAENITPEGRAANRRVEFKLMPSQSGAVFEGITIIE
jgi:chemotaxis protein MotB